MALWTPYAQEIALDLTKSCVQLESDTSTIAPQTNTQNLRPVQNTRPRQNADLKQRDTQLYESPQLYREAQDVHRNVHTAQPYYMEPQHYGYTYQPTISYGAPSVSSDSTANSNAARLSPSPDNCDVESFLEDPEYQAFERDALRAMAEKNGGTLLEKNPRMRRAVQSSQVSDDILYRKQRERNNYAAKQSRDRRKLKEIRLALQVTYLKKKLVELKASRATGLCGRCNAYKYS